MPIFTGHEWGRKRRISGPKSNDQHPEPRRSHTHQIHSNPQQSPYVSPPLATISHPAEYGGNPGNPPQHYSAYGTSSQLQHRPTEGYVPAPNQHSQQYLAGSNANLTSPPTENRNLLSTQWNRAGRLASKSCENLSNQITDSANKSATLVEKSVNRSVGLTTKSVSTITTYGIVKPTNLVTKKSVQALNQTAALCDRISDKFDAVITSMDGGVFSGDERDLYVYDETTQASSSTSPPPKVTRERKASNPNAPSNDNGSNFFSKVWLYSNARLPPHLPPFKVYVPTYSLLCLAAKYSERAYEPVSSATSETHIPADWRSGTKAMVLKSLPVDDMNTIVFAIRGSQTFMDWAVNYRTAPSSPKDFLDDAGNLCHAGFLYVAKKMVKPVAERLRVLLQENPARSNASLLITGHSAGGAVAGLLFAHMMSSNTQSELSYLTGFFKRVHCVTFGAPPVSLLPLKKPSDRQYRKSLFYSFINEGDPVPRADRDVVKSLLRLYSSPSPNVSCVTSSLANLSRLNISSSTNTSQNIQTASTYPMGRPGKFSKPSKTSLKTTSSNSTTASLPAYPIVPGSLSPSGRLIVLRNKPGSHSIGGEEVIEAVTVEDEMLRSVVYGDPMKHMMKLYRKRVERIATRAITGADW
ncbi:unnamed protein product [Periconia digitata]|uniref:Fungal lipase-type domain-containing protein n=1 Tax=Periconia digitata TaxID=1303443 RepID=A0A9W4UJT0_9PLEO|nr:unnamed protein product [Periconia digitata]